jgi:hypothetical protein
MSIEEPPAATAIGEALRLAVGVTGRGLTVTDTVASGLAPPGPVQVNAKVEFVVSAPVLRVPLGAKVPLHPPEAVQEVALAEDQVSVAEPPASIAVLDASREATGSAVTGAEPPQADRADAAPNTQSEAINRMEFRSYFLWMNPIPWINHPPWQCADAFFLCSAFHRTDSIMSHGHRQISPRTTSRKPASPRALFR